MPCGEAAECAVLLYFYDYNGRHCAAGSCDVRSVSHAMEACSAARTLPASALSSSCKVSGMCKHLMHSNACANVFGTQSFGTRLERRRDAKQLCHPCAAVEWPLAINELRCTFANVLANHDKTLQLVSVVHCSVVRSSALLTSTSEMRAVLTATVIASRNVVLTPEQPLADYARSSVVEWHE